jgi:hypothetical protein
MVWRLVLGEDWWDARGDTTLSGLALGVDAPSECPTSPKAEVKGASESPDVGERDRDLDAWLDILRRVLGSKPVKREPPSGVSQPKWSRDEGSPRYGNATRGLTRVIFTMLDRTRVAHS